MYAEKRCVARLAGVLLLSFAFSHSVEAKLGFKPAVSYPVGTAPLAVAVGDFNGDGKPDLAVANAGNPEIGDGNVSILLGNGDGTFQAALNVATGKNPVAIAVGDFNRDGRLDVVVANIGRQDPAGGWLPGTVSVLLGNGDGSFQKHVDFGTASGPIYPDSVAVGDFNGDHVLDLAVAAHPAAVVSVLLGNGDGTFQPHVDYAAGFAGAVAVVDVNQDGKVDLAVSGAGGVVGILEGNGDGTFQPAVGYGQATGFSRSLASGDFNGDGKVDLVASTGIYGSGHVSVLLNNGGGIFSSALGTAGCDPLVADFDGDGKLDVAVIGWGVGQFGCVFGAGTILVFSGNGDGTFQSPASFLTTNNAKLVATADLDGNQTPDLVIVNGTSGNSENTVSVLLNAPSPSVTLTTSASTQVTGQRVTLTWSSQNADSCAASGGAAGDGWSGSMALSGAMSITESSPGTFTYSLTCTGTAPAAIAQATVSFTAASGSGSGGGMLDPLWLLLLSLLTLQRRIWRARSGAGQASPGQAGDHGGRS